MQNGKSKDIVEQFEKATRQLKDLTSIANCPKNSTAFVQWKLRLSDIINTSDFLDILAYLQYQVKLDDGTLRKEAENLWKTVNSITQQEADNYKVFGKMDDFRGLVNDLADMLKRKAAILKEQSASGGKAKGATAKKRYRKPVIIATLITAVATILAPVIVWFLNSHSNKQGVSIQKNVSTSAEVETTGNLSPAVVTSGPNSPVNIYIAPGQLKASSEVRKMDVNRPK